jgi:hypothetical protein
VYCVIEGEVSAHACHDGHPQAIGKTDMHLF